MKQADLIKYVLAGRPVVVVEYRSFKIEQIKYADKRTGQQVTQNMVKHSIELGDTQASMGEFLPVGADISGVKQQFKKGDKLVCTIQGIENVKGFASIRGMLEPLET